MGFQKSEYEVQKMSTADASEYARRLVDGESRGHGDIEGALHRLEQRYGVGRWQLAHLRSGKAKSCEMGLFLRLRAAYLDMCQRKLTRLQHDLAIEEAKGGGTDDLADLEHEAAALAAKIEAKKAALRLKASNGG